ncbi:hypothetical protein TNCV_2763901 [Trichonephila clavipes]|nr:hypothetical protein TNCV_2763901 [Trichonephila clavipes]
MPTVQIRGSVTDISLVFINQLCPIPFDSIPNGPEKRHLNLSLLWQEMTRSIVPLPSPKVTTTVTEESASSDP